MPTPYSQKPDAAFWRRAMAGRGPDGIDPVLSVSFTIRRDDKVATAGSCFAQHIAAALQHEGFHYMVTELAPSSGEASSENYGVFPARFGNIYTVRQLLQLLKRAYGLFAPLDETWRRPDGRFVDPFRPLIQSDGFESADALLADREAHFSAVRRMFEECDVFVFTLGLTESWMSAHDGAVFPLVPQAVAEDLGAEDYAFHNFSVAEMTTDFKEFVRRLRQLNPAVKIILTVSPVALIATFEDRHVLVSNTLSKAALRVVADEVSHACENVVYFPSYEMITGPHVRSAYLDDDLREVRPEGVASVMSVFTRHYLNASQDAELPVARPRLAEIGGLGTTRSATEEETAHQRWKRVICDEADIEARL